MQERGARCKREKRETCSICKSVCKRGDTHDLQHLQEKLKGDLVDTQEGVQDMRLGGSAREAGERHIKHLHGCSQAILEALRHLRKTRMQ
jgi:hypothetical protein